MNPYYRHSRLTTDVFLILVWMFVRNYSMQTASKELGLSVRSVGEIYRGLRTRIAEHSVAYPPKLEGTVQADVFDFGSDRGTGWRGARVITATRPLVFGLMDQHGRVYVSLVPDRRKATLQGAISNHVVCGSVLITSGWGGYGNLTEIGMSDHIRVKIGPSRGLWFPGPGARIGDFWEVVDRKIRGMRGVQNTTFFPLVKDCELRWNQRGKHWKELYETLLGILRERPL